MACIHLIDGMLCRLISLLVFKFIFSETLCISGLIIDNTVMPLSVLICIAVQSVDNTAEGKMEKDRTYSRIIPGHTRIHSISALYDIPGNIGIH